MSACAWCGAPATTSIVVREGRTSAPDPMKRRPGKTVVAMQHRAPACADCARGIVPSTFEGKPPKVSPAQMTIYDDEEA